MAVNRLRLAWDVLTNQNKNYFNEAFYKAVGMQTTTYNPTLETLITKGYGGNPDVNAIVNRMASKTSSVPYIIRPIDDEKSFKKLQRYTNDPTFLQKKSIDLLKKEAFKSSEQSIPLSKPNPNQTWEEILFLYKTYLKICGNVYFYRMSNSMGVPIALYVLPSHWMQIVLKSKASTLSYENPIDYYILEQGNQFVKFEQDTVIHIKRANPFYNQNGSHLYGYSELMAAIRNINSSNSMIDANVKTAQNSGAYGFLHAKDGQSPLSQEQADSLKERLVDMRNDSGFLSNIAGASAAIGFTRISLNTDELQPFAFLSNDRRTLCNCLNYPIALLNEERSGSGFGTDEVIEARKLLITDNIEPDLKLLASYLNPEFIQKFKGYEKSVLEFDITELPEMQVDMSKMIDWIVKSPLTLNEIREAINYEPIEDENMDVVYISSSSKRIDDPSIDEMESNG